jgi:DNA-directed RNA polymerase specialized sigma24 family protein/anti-sigma factor RsiW
MIPLRTKALPAGGLVADRTPGTRVPDDAGLLNQVRSGDTAAFGTLYQRHVFAVRRLASYLVPSPAESDHLVAETFALVHEVTRRGGGPTDAFRPYMLSALRHGASGRRQPSDPGEPIGAGPDSPRFVRGFVSLPERWRAVLWHTEIEQDSPAEVAVLLGRTQNGVAALRRRAREGLRQAVLRAYISNIPQPGCRPVAELLGSYLRDALSAGDAGLVAAHLSTCSRCEALRAELSAIGVSLRDLVAPVYLGGAAAFYLSDLGRDARPPAGIAAPLVTRALAAPAVAATAESGAGARHRAGRARRPVWLGAGVAAAVVLTVAIALAAGGTAPPRSGHHLQAGADSSLGAAATSQTTPARAGKTPRATPSAAGSKSHAGSSPPDGSPGQGGSPTAPASSSPPSPPPASPSAAPSAKLTAAISLTTVGRGITQVVFQVSDTGTAATGELTASVSLPAGSWMFGGHHGGGQSGWGCQSDSAGASCQHDAIGAGDAAQGTIFIGAAGPACGQPVQMTVTSGTASASATSPQDIQCGNGQAARDSALGPAAAP